MKTIATALAKVTERLETAGIENARFEARLLLCHVLDVQTQILIGYPEREVLSEDASKLEELLQRRENREPMSHIIGSREFWSLDFKVTKDTLTPRPDTETLVEAVLRHFPDMDAKLQVADLGVGTGCLLLSVLSEYQNATGLGVDLSDAALTVAKENALNLDLASRSTFQIGNWLAGIDRQFDLILSNPPYIPLVDRERLEPEVKDFEPDSALFAGEDGLNDYRTLAKQLPDHLKDQGKAVIELGIGQADAVTALMEEQGLQVVEQPRDLGGIIRCLVICKKL